MNIYALCRIPENYINYKNVKIIGFYSIIGYILINRDVISNNSNISNIIPHILPIFIYGYIILFMRKLPIKIEV
jgi:hypothetical protein